MFDDIKELPEKFGKVFAQQQMQMIANSCNFHIGVSPDGKVCFDVNGANPQLVAESFIKFRKALKEVGIE